MKLPHVILVFLAALSALLAPCFDGNAKKPHRVIIEVTHEGMEQWTAVLNNVENLRNSLGDPSEIEVVGHSKGLGMMLAKDNELADRMKKLTDAGVAFSACENTMRKKNVTKDQLLPFAKTVDSGVGEVIRKQEAGWTYLKSGI